MAERSTSSSTQYVSDDSASEAGAEAGEAFAEMGIKLTEKYPKISVSLGIITTALFVYYGLANWEFHPIIFTLMTLVVFLFSTFFIMSAAIIAAAIGLAGLIIMYLISLL
jgi:hypothetical protein